jgi:hypothetical protein
MVSQEKMVRQELMEHQELPGRKDLRGSPGRVSLLHQFQQVMQASVQV